MVWSAKLRIPIGREKDFLKFFSSTPNKIFITSVISLRRRDENSNQRLQGKDTLGVYDDDNEDWPHPNPLQRERGLRHREKPAAQR